ncbi:variant erythrocyte surface antigen-1 family protein [Babesia caballi]|uniref:Variant erythrocyte surface antigen-1 family protein n=1 Tax=Babesia caballi TaxID=5871 RepID=A0AAV4LSN3_BABCB|nr:variant erythrocyte surface antigen-1 family protein [Babesia caballi]
MTAAVQKSLTDPPTNLKEAIDWVLQIKRDGHAQDLADALEELLKHDGSEVAVKVLDKYRLASKGVIVGLMSNKPSEPAHGFAVPHAILNKLSLGLEPFHERSAAISRKTLEQWVSSVDKNTLKTLIDSLVKGLETFVDSQGSGIVKNPYTSAYKSDVEWNSLTDSDKRDCAAILLGIMPVVYIGLTYLYWQCEGTNGWDTEQLTDGGSDQGSLKKYMEAFGYAENDLNKSTTGGSIATQLMHAFSQLQTAYTKAKPKPPPSTSPSYPDFLKALQEKVHWSPSLSRSSPLTSLYLISHYYITNFLYIVEPTSPATPSFAGYSGTAALAGGAYGLNLGGLGTVMSALLA